MSGYCLFSNRNDLDMNLFTLSVCGTTACSGAWGTSVAGQWRSPVEEGSEKIGQDDVLMKLINTCRK